MLWATPRASALPHGLPTSGRASPKPRSRRGSDRVGLPQCCRMGVFLLLMTPAQPVMQFEGILKLSSSAFQGGFEDGVWGYCLPGTESETHGTVVRFALDDFATVQVLDLATKDPDLKGFLGGFRHGGWGYVMPYHNSGGGFGKVARFNLTDFTTVQVLDLEAAVPGLTCFSGGFAESTWGYAIPRHGSVMARFDLVHFTLVEALDLRATDSHLHDCFGGFGDGEWGYALTGDGWVGRFLLANWSTVQVLEVKATDPGLKRLQAGFAHNGWGYIATIAEGPGSVGKLARFNLVSFGQVQVLDPAAGATNYKGYTCTFMDDMWGYAVPYAKDAASSNKLVRFALSDFSTLEALDLRGPSPAQVFGYGFISGMYAYLLPYHKDFFNVTRVQVKDPTTTSTTSRTSSSTATTSTTTSSTSSSTSSSFTNTATSTITSLTTTFEATTTSTTTAAAVEVANVVGQNDVPALVVRGEETESSTAEVVDRIPMSRVAMGGTVVASVTGGILLGFLCGRISKRNDGPVQVSLAPGIPSIPSGKE